MRTAQDKNDLSKGREQDEHWTSMRQVYHKYKKKMNSN